MPGRPNLVGVSAGGVHAHDPIGLAAAAGRVFERLHLPAVAQRGEPFPDRLGGQGRDPQAPHGLSAPRELVEVGEDQLPLPSRVASVDDLRNRRRTHKALHDTELLAGLRVDLYLELLGDDGQRLQAPPLVLLAVSVGRRQLREVPYGPGDGPPIPDQGALLPAVASQGVRQVPGYGRFLGDDEPHERSIREENEMAAMNSSPADRRRLRA